jgi:hypothetical protein
MCLTVFIHPKYHPDIKWRQIRKDKFQIIYPHGYEAEAIYTLESAATVYSQLREIWGNEIKGTIRILLSDARDYANGSATFFPFNLIEIYLFNPQPDGYLSNYRDRIRISLSHEMTHLFNMNAGSKFTYFLRKYLGTNPVLFPVIIAPVWLMEGWAIYGESLLNEWGRLNTPEFDILLGHIAGARKVPRWPYIFGDSTAWPASSTPYLYGAKFIQYLEGLYGQEKIRGLLRQYSRYFIPITFKKNMHLVPLTIRNRFKRVFHRDLHDLWREFVASINVREAGWGRWDNPERVIERLSDEGMFNQYPIFLDKNNIIFFHRDFRQFPGLYQMNLLTGKKRKVLRKAEIGSMFLDRVSGEVYLSANNYYQSFYIYSDLYHFSPHTGRLQRLSKGQRLSSPIVIDGTIICVKRDKTRSYLVEFQPGTGKTNTLSRGYEALAFLSPSPDGKRIAVSLKQYRKNWVIGVFDRKGKLLKMIGDGQYKTYYPQWKNHRDLFFISEYKRQYRLMSYNTESAELTLFEKSHLPSIKYFSFLPGTNTLIGSFYDANGYNLGTMDLNRLNIRSLQRPHLKEVEVRKRESPKDFEDTPYSPLPDLLPKYFSPLFRYGGNEVQPGIYFTGNDAVGRHSMSLEAYYGIESRSANVVFDYIYDRFTPSFQLHFSNLTDWDTSASKGEFIQENRKLAFIGMFPLRTSIERQLRVYGDIHFEHYRDHYTLTGEQFEGQYNGIRLGLVNNTSRRYYDSLSLNDGSWTSLSYSHELKLLGSEYNIQSASLEHRHYSPFFRPDVFALRLAVADSWGDGRRIYYMGGATSQAGNIIGGNQLFKLMRGYPSGYFIGTGGWLMNLEYRIALVKIEKVFLLFRSFERIYISLFSDIGNVWGIGDFIEKKIDPSYSFGVELNLIAYIGRDKYNICAGVAAGHNPDHKPVFYVRLGNSF